MTNPPHLKAIAPQMVGPGPIIESMLLDGVTLLHLWASWTPMMAVDVADKLEKQGKDVSQMRAMIMRAFFNQDEVLNFLPLKDIPHYRFDGVREIWQSRLRLAVPGPELKGRAEWWYQKVTVPCLHVSGWYDIYTRGAFLNFNGMWTRGGSEDARKGQHVLMGPWAHGAQLPAFVGDLHFGPSAGGVGGLSTLHHLTFFDKYLRGKDVPLPSVRYFVMGKNRWQTSDVWPPAPTRPVKFYLHSGGRANTSAGDGVLSQVPPQAEPVDSFVYDPLHPVQTVGGRVVVGASQVAGPIDQYMVEKRPDVLCYTTAELGADLEIAGPVTLHLFASTAVKDTDFTGKLVDVYPDGRAYTVADGIMRARYRRSIFESQFVVPGEINEYAVSLGQTSQLFKKGHRIRLEVSSSNFPQFDRNMNTGNELGEDTTGMPATQTIYHRAEYASYLELPVERG
jgi:putative CocE/NonD family hydrolase